MKSSVKITLKRLIPGYRRKWRQQAAVFLCELGNVLGEYKFGWSDGLPTATRQDGLTVFGFESVTKDLELLRLIRDFVPKDLDPRHFRLARDLVTRFKYPHLRPDLDPRCGENLSGLQSVLSGFHGQHKDTILHMDDPVQRGRYLEHFTPHADDVILDFGAYLGFGELALSPLLTNGQMIAVEANPGCHAILSKNIDANGVSNVRHVHAAVWNKHGGTMSLAVGEAQANTLLPDLYDGGGRAEVPTVSVDGIVSDYGLERVTMVSLTVNGAEIEALEGAVDTLHRLRPRIRLAGWYLRDGRPVADICGQMLRDAGYDVYVGKRHGVLAVPMGS